MARALTDQGRGGTLALSGDVILSVEEQVVRLGAPRVDERRRS